MQRAAERASEQYCTSHTPIRYLRSLFIPGEARCLCLFEAPNEALVAAVNDAAQLPYTRIVAALDLDPLLRQSGVWG
jgi:hypothetical protein